MSDHEWNPCARSLNGNSFGWKDPQSIVFQHIQFQVLGSQAALYEGMSMGEYLVKNGYSQAFQRHYLLPMCAAVWSVPNAKVPLEILSPTLSEMGKRRGEGGPMLTLYCKEVTGTESFLQALTLNGSFHEGF